MESPFDLVSMSTKTFALYIEPILEPTTKEYKSVLTVDREPDGPLKTCVIQAKLPELSSFKYPYDTGCSYYLTKYPGTKTFMYREDIPKVFAFLESNGYVINAALTKMYRGHVVRSKELVCVINYT